MRTAAALLAASLLSCATTDARLTAYRSLSEHAREQYDRYQPFMTDDLRERYLAAHADTDRDAMVASMKVEERLAAYPPGLQDAIWARQVVAGMDKAAVFMAAGRPQSIERVQAEEPKAPKREIWSFEGGTGRGDFRVIFVDGVVNSVERDAR